MLPSDLVEHFKITKVELTNESIDISLDEFETPPIDSQGDDMESKGFLEPVNARDFPLRDRKLTFKVRRRKWLDKTTGKYITNRFDIVVEGTRHSNEFAVF